MDYNEPKSPRQQPVRDMALPDGFPLAAVAAHLAGTSGLVGRAGSGRPAPASG